MINKKLYLYLIFTILLIWNTKLVKATTCYDLCSNFKESNYQVIICFPNSINNFQIPYMSEEECYGLQSIINKANKTNSSNAITLNTNQNTETTTIVTPSP